MGKLGRCAKALGKIVDGADAIRDMEKLKNAEAGVEIVTDVSKLQKGETAVEAVTDAARVADNYNRGKAAEKFISETYGGAGKGFEVTVGNTKKWRFVDAFDAASGIARKSKIGRVSATSFTKAQIQKDVQLLLDGAVDKVEWLFSTSSKTGKGVIQKALKRL